MTLKKIFLTITLSILIPLTSSAQSVGLVLSGGGAKGIAHIGVIQALEDNDIPIDFITGTSMGSIVGGLYAAGYTPKEMMALLLSKDFSNWSTGQIDENLTYYFSKPDPSPAMLNVNFNFGDSLIFSTSILPKSLINPLPMNFAFMDLFASYTAQCNGNFNNLFVPFRCVASNVYDKHKIIFSSGSLGDAIRASMSFPIVFAPIKVDGVYAFDGGIYDNFPIDVMREDFAPAFMLGINVSSGNSSTAKDNIIDQIEAMIMQPQNDSIPPESGMKININLSDFGLLDFPKAEAIYKVGYDKAMSMMDSIKSRISKRIPRETVQLKRNVFKSQTPEVLFDSVTVSGGNKEQNEYIKFLFDKNMVNDTLDLEKARTSFYRAISSGKIKNLLPQAVYNPNTGLYKLNLQATIGDKFAVGAGGYLTSSTNSMIYLNVGYKTLSFNSFGTSIGGWIGQSYYAGEFNASISLKTRIPSTLRFQGVLSRQKFYESDVLFYNDDMPSFILMYDNYVRLKYGMAIGRKAKMEIGLGYGYLRDKFYPTNTVDYSKTKQDEAQYKLGQIYNSIESSSLDSYNYPTKGHSYKATIMGIYGQDRYLPQSSAEGTYYKNCWWIQAEFEGSKYWQLSNNIALGTHWDFLISNKKLFDNYTATIVQAPAFMPTPSTQNYFNTDFRANSFLAAGILPIWKIIPNLQFRTEFYAFVPFHKIIEGPDQKPLEEDLLSKVSFIGEASLVYNFSFASLSLYGNYLSYPARNWNFGISFGILLPPQKFLR